MDGTVCPVVPVPVGTGVLIAGGNFNSTDNNQIWDNWRYGTMQFWVPAPLRDEFDPSKLYDTSHNNHTFGNVFGIKPNGDVAHNGMDHWWDDEGEGNCWERQRVLPRRADRQLHRRPPACADGGSVYTPGVSRQGRRLPELLAVRPQRPDLRHPPECNWFDTPPKPTDDYGRARWPRRRRGAQPRAHLRRAATRSDCSAIVPLLGTGAALRARPVGRRGACVRPAPRRARGTARRGRCRGGGRHRSAELTAGGETERRGARRRPVFEIADRTIRQIRYADNGELVYTFELTNDGRFPVTVKGLAPLADPALFDFVRLTDAAGAERFTIGRATPRQVSLTTGDDRAARRCRREPGASSTRSPSGRSVR